jgi:hypothetical protein
MQNHDKMLVIYIPHQKNFFDKYRCHTYNRWQIALIPVASSSGLTYKNVVSVFAEEYNRYRTYITTYPPSGARAFNSAQAALHTLRECIHVLRKRPHDIPRSPHPRFPVVSYPTIDMQPLPHDRDCPHENLILRGWVRDSHHLAGGNLPSYIFVGASLLNSKLHKANAKNKSQLACHLLRLLYSLYGHLSV